MKKNKNLQALQDLIDIYNHLYPSSKIYTFSKLFKYSEKELDEIFSYFEQNNKDNDKVVPKAKSPSSSRKKKSALPPISSKEDVEEYYYSNMIYNRSDEKAKKIILDKHSADDLKLLFEILYNSKPYPNKNANFTEIQNYFDNLQRAKNL